MMHYYQFNIGEYASHTRHLSPIEDIAYRRLLDLAYTTELPLIKDTRQLSRLVNLREYEQEITDILNEFFFEVNDGWVSNRVLKEIEKTGRKTEAARNSVAKRWDNERKEKEQELIRTQYERNTNVSETDTNVTENDTTNNPLPITHNQEPKEHVSLASAKDHCPQQAIIDLYHCILPTMPRVREWTPARQAKLRGRWKENSERQSLEWWADWFGFVAESDFLCGRTKKPFVCNLEWLITPANFVKVLEGNYENNEVTA